MPWQLSGNGRSGWSTKLIRGLKAEAAAGFQSRRERCREPTPVNPHYAALATYKAAHVRFWHKADIQLPLGMSAFGGKADIARVVVNVRYWPKAAMQPSQKIASKPL